MRMIFTKEQIFQLKQHPCVYGCTERSVNYTQEFKKSALALYAQGVSPKEIWKRSGFDVRIWKEHYFRLTIRDWRRIVARSGEDGLARLGGIQYDRGPNNTEKDTIKRLKLQVKYLEAENAFLAKLRAKRAE